MHTITLDNSAFNLLYCERRFQLAVIQGLRGASSSTAEFGNAFHTGVEALDKTNDVLAAMAAVQDAGYKVNELKLIEALTNLKLTANLPPALVLTTGQPAIEVKFSLPYSAVTLAGTVDRIHITDDDILEFVDYKTASDFKDASQQAKMQEYENSFQLPFYVFCMVRSGLLPAHALELYAAGRYRTKYIFVFYTGVPIKIIKREFSPYKEEFWNGRFATTLQSHINKALEISELETAAPYSGMNTYKGCTYCPYRPGCVALDETYENSFLERFEKTPYDPSSFR